MRNHAHSSVAILLKTGAILGTLMFSHFVPVEAGEMTQPVAQISATDAQSGAFGMSPLGEASSEQLGEPRQIVANIVRFQVLTPFLLRMEYSPNAQFIDEPSVAVINRDQWPSVSFESKITDGWLEIQTQEILLRYKADSGPFSADNLRVTWTAKDGERTWRPGDADDKNLGGVPASLDNRSMQIVTDPGPLSRGGYYFMDDSKTALFDMASDWVKPRETKDNQDLYFLVYRSDYESALLQLSKLIGPIPMLPRYVFGSWFGSRNGYSADQWKMIVEQFEEEDLPLDVLVLDSDSTTNVTWSGYDWDLEQMPDPKAFFKWMNERDVKVTVNEHYAPLTRVSESNFEKIRKVMGLPPKTEQINHDIADKKYAGLFMDLLHKPALDMGMAFWWQDGAAGTDMDGLDPYLWTRHVEYEGQEKITGMRTTAFCRLGSAVGSHRYGVFFTGDLTGIWESLPVLTMATVRGGNQLMPYMNNLCGGVFVVKLPQELYQRWVQFGAFSPIIWFHGLWGLRLPWEYGEDGVETYRKFVGLRYALLPYIYTYSRIAHDTGLPLVRGMYLEFPDQENAYNFQQQYMFGEEFLVAPITEPGNGQPVTREVFLPAGFDWHDYFTGDIYEGGRVITYECPIDRMPLFVKAGSIIPLAPKMNRSGEKPLDPLTLDVYAGANAEFTLYEDDGVSLGYRKGQCAWTPLTFKSAGDRTDYELNIGPMAGKFKGQPKNRRYEVRIHGLLEPEKVRLNGRELPRLQEGECKDGWEWISGSAVIHIAKPTSIQTNVTISLEKAGTFSDMIALAKISDFRGRVRTAKLVMKLKHAELLGGMDIKKPPRAIREAEKIERELNSLIANPNGLGKKTIDFEAKLQSIMQAVNERPFESDRAIPDVEPETINATQKIENAQFTEEEIERISAILKGKEVQEVQFRDVVTTIEMDLPASGN